MTHHLDASRSTLARRLLIPLGQWPYLPDRVKPEGGALTKKVTKVDETDFDACRKRLFFFCGFRFRYHHSATTSGSSPPPISSGTASRAEQPTGVVKEVKTVKRSGGTWIVGKFQALSKPGPVTLTGPQEGGETTRDRVQQRNTATTGVTKKNPHHQVKLARTCVNFQARHPTIAKKGPLFQPQ